MGLSMAEVVSTGVSHMYDNSTVSVREQRSEGSPPRCLHLPSNNYYNLFS